jgi:hypothetical protein
MNRYQFTMWSTKGNAPVAATIEANSRLDFASDTEFRRKAIQQICARRGWTTHDLYTVHGYGKYKVRLAPAPLVKPQGSINL